MAPRRSARISEQVHTPDTSKSTTSLAQVGKGKGKKQSNPNGIVKKQKPSSAKATLKKQAPEEFEVPALPVTPRKNQQQPADDEASVSRDIPRLTPPPRLDRPVDPHKTNATLMTPRGSSVVAYPSVLDVSPTKNGSPQPPTTTTGNLLEKALEHLIAADSRLKPVIEKFHCRIFSPEGLAEQIDPFESLASSIIGQQVSGAAARSIKNKFLDLFDNTAAAATAAAGENDQVQRRRFPTPAEVVRCDLSTLRTAGLSQRKAEYIHGLAEKFANGELSTQKLLKATDEEVMEMLTAVRGLGRWSVEMFSCFALKRTDVFSTGDLGVQRGCAAFVGRDVNKLKNNGKGKFKYMSENDMLELAEKFRPYRSLFMWYMWRVEDVDIAVLN